MNNIVTGILISLIIIEIVWFIRLWKTHKRRMNEFDQIDLLIERAITKEDFEIIDEKLSILKKEIYE